MCVCVCVCVCVCLISEIDENSNEFLRADIFLDKEEMVNFLVFSDTASVTANKEHLIAIT